MDQSNFSSKKYYLFLLFYFLLWVILFEFVLPVNQILPKPSIVFESFDDLWVDYNLPLNYLSTITVVYISILAAYLCLSILKYAIIKRDNFVSNFILSFEWFSEYIPGIMIALLLIYWFPESEYIEFVFAFLIAFFSIMIKLQKAVPKIDASYTDAAVSLGASEKEIIKKIEWPLLQPSVINHLTELHLYIWSMLLAFEYIKGGLGLGSIFSKAINYKDISAIFSVFIIVGITVFLGNAALRFFRNKYFSWENV